MVAHLIVIMARLLGSKCTASDYRSQCDITVGSAYRLITLRRTSDCHRHV